MRRLALCGSVLLLAICTGGLEASVVIDFESLRVDDAEDNHRHGTTYSEDGFTLTAAQPQGLPTQFKSVGTLSTLFAGSTALFHIYGTSETILTRSDGGLFDLTSIDLAALPNRDAHTQIPIDDGPFDVEFFGTKADGTIVTNIITVDSFITLTPYEITGFTGLESVNWFNGGWDAATETEHGRVHQFDNIIVESSVIPEPTTLVVWSLLATLGLSFGRRRRRRAF